MLIRLIYQDINQRTYVLNDSKPCVQALDKLARGEYLANRRVTSSLSIASRFQVTILACTASLPSDSPLLCGFREGYGTQHALLRLIETCKKTLDKGGFAGALLMDLSKAFDCLSHELLIAILSAYGFSPSALRLIHSYLSESLEVLLSC